MLRRKKISQCKKLISALRNLKKSTLKNNKKFFLLYKT